MDDINEKYIQNNSGNTYNDNSYSHQNQYTAKLEKLYEDKIMLLEDKVKHLETEIER